MVSLYAKVTIKLLNKHNWNNEENCYLHVCVSLFLDLRG